MARLREEKRNELEAFWRGHIRGWRDSTLNHREYCEAHGLPLKRFGNWWAKLRHEDPRLAAALGSVSRVHAADPRRYGVLRGGSGTRMYIMTARRMISGLVLK